MSCGEKFEVLRSLKDEETEVKCPKCGASDAQRLYSPFGQRSSTNSCSPIPRLLAEVDLGEAVCFSIDQIRNDSLAMC